MPRGDGTGPMGMGPASGWSRGSCLDTGPWGQAGPAGQGRRGQGTGQGGYGRGMGRGRCWRANAEPAASVVRNDPGRMEERRRLQRQVEELETSLEAVKARLANLSDS